MRRTNTARKLAVLSAVATLFAPAQAMATSKTAPAPIAKSVYQFKGGTIDGATPNAGLVADSNHNLFGTTQTGGKYGKGIVFELPALLPSAKGVARKEIIIHNFSGGADGQAPVNGLISNSNNGFFGATTAGGNNQTGTVFEIVGGKYTKIGDNLKGATPINGLAANAAGQITYTTNGTLGVKGSKSQIGVLSKVGSKWTVPTVIYDLTPTNPINLFSVVPYKNGFLAASGNDLAFDNGDLFTVQAPTKEKTNWTVSEVARFAIPLGERDNPIVMSDGSIRGIYGPANGQTVYKATPAAKRWVVSSLCAAPGYEFVGGSGVDGQGSIYVTSLVSSSSTSIGLYKIIEPNTSVGQVCSQYKLLVSNLGPSAQVSLIDGSSIYVTNQSGKGTISVVPDVASSTVPKAAISPPAP